MSDRLLEGVKDGERLTLSGSGAWIAANARALEPAIDAESQRGDGIKRVDIDMGRVDRLDTFGAWLLERLVRNFSARGCDTQVLGLKEDYRALMSEVHSVKLDARDGRPRRQPVRQRAGRHRLQHRLGRAIVRVESPTCWARWRSRSCA